MTIDIVLAGVGGQGILSIANVLGIAALKENLYLKQAEVHGMSQRGGDVQSNLRISDSPISSDLIPYGKADLIVSLEPMESLRYINYLGETGWIITNTNPFVNISSYPDIKEVMNELEQIDNLVAFDMDQLAKDLGSPRSANMILLGAASPFLQIHPEIIEDGIKKLFESKGDKIVESNLKCFEAGRETAISLIKERKIKL